MSALMPYDQGAETLERAGQIPISAATAWRLAQEYGEEFRQWEERAEGRACASVGGGEA